MAMQGDEDQSRRSSTADRGAEIAKADLASFAQGTHRHAYRFLGAHCTVQRGVRGVRFATWAPNADRVSVVGDFNSWDGRRHLLQVRGSSGVWESFIPELDAGSLYKFEIRCRHDGSLRLKSDPFGRCFELRPATASIIAPPSEFDWHDQLWRRRRAQWDWRGEPISIYEVHLGSWRRAPDGTFLNYRELAHQLVAHVADLGFTHIELMPIAEHPYDASWGYQVTGYFAPTSRFGDADDFRYFVDYCHRHNIGVILDWVAGHFPKDEHGLARFDGTALYEHHDVRLAEHPDWGTLVFNLGRYEVASFLLSNAYFWFEEFHIDGLRVDAVASMLYRDYSREDGNWVPNEFGGREDLDAIRFLRTLNEQVHGAFPGALVIAEESTAWPQVSRPTYAGGLGFSMKWNMGWMNDTLSYLAHDPVHRKYHHDALTFGLLYAFHENFVMPLSHDEVVHGKRSLLAKMPGDDWQRFATLRLLYVYLVCYPGKKLLFMGSELAPDDEWWHERALPWDENSERSTACSLLLRNLLTVYRETPALFRFDFESRGFEWIDCHDMQQSVLSFQRLADNGRVVVVLNFTPVMRENYRIGVAQSGFYREVLNSDAACFGGSDVGNAGGCHTEPVPWMGHDYSLSLTLPPLAGLILQCS
jgi:1,4-alpha-glucan branching enzyme